VNELRSAGIKKKIVVHLDDLKYKNPIPKIPHNRFTILYYWPGDRDNASMWQWIYGYDIYQQIRLRLGDKVDWIVIIANQDMKPIFPIIDFYLRPNRHDGSSRLRRECEIQGIPYYWTRKNPDIKQAIQYITRSGD